MIDRELSFNRRMALVALLRRALERGAAVDDCGHHRVSVRGDVDLEHLAGEVLDSLEPNIAAAVALLDTLKVVDEAFTLYPAAAAVHADRVQEAIALADPSDAAGRLSRIFSGKDDEGGFRP